MPNNQLWASRVNEAAGRIVRAKEHGGKVVVATGSGPNIHEGVTTLIAGLMRQGIVDGVLTSAAVVAHEMAGTLDRVKRVRAADYPSLDIPARLLPRGGVFEITMLPPDVREWLQDELPDGWSLYEAIEHLEGDLLIKAAGNMAWPMGLRTERLARDLESHAKRLRRPLEWIAGQGADPMTMIGAAREMDLPCLVSIPQLVGGGAVGLSIGDSIPLRERARLVAGTLAGADVIVESAIALSQEIHDGPFETYTGHGIWAGWDGEWTYSMEEKSIVRIDLDPALEMAWRKERESSEIQDAVNRGLPKTKVTGIPFRMEMSGFARLEGSLPLVGDIGEVWPALAGEVAARLGVRLDFISAPQESAEGKAMREWIVENVRPVRRDLVLRNIANLPGDSLPE